MVDFQKINSYILPQLGGYVAQWIPCGTLNGVNYTAKNPMRADKTAGSFKININTGVWTDFAVSGVGGGDVISLYAYLFTGGNQLESAKELEKITGLLPPPPPPKKRKAWVIISPVPKDAPKLDNFLWRKNPGNKEWYKIPLDVTYPYYNIDGELIGYTIRVTKEERKEVLPMAFCESNEGERKWRQRGFKGIYGIQDLNKKPDAMVLIVEGEKCRDYAQKMFANVKSIVPLAWLGGSNRWKNNGWNQIKNRKILLWADADEPGIKCMTELGKELFKNNTDCKLVDCCEKHSDGYDIADLIDGGANISDVYAFMKKYLREISVDDDVEKIAPVGHANKPALIKKEPFKFLGYTANMGSLKFYFYSNKLQSIVGISSGSFAPAKLLVLAPLDFWEDMFPSRTGFDVSVATDYLIRHSTERGLFNPENIRGRGAWIDDGKIVLHLGNKLIIDGCDTDISKYDSDYIYEKRLKLENIGYTTTDILPQMEAVKLLQALKLLGFTKPRDYLLYAGWLMTAPICGALNWRPHLWITGEAGSGKTWVHNHITSNLLGGSLLSVAGASTEAGLRQRLGSDALPVAFDEAEGQTNEDVFRMKKILELARQASSSFDSPIIKGSADGVANSYSVRAQFLFSSINPQMSTQADESRITVLELHRASYQNFEKLNGEYMDLITDKKWSERLRGRSAKMIKVVRENIKVFTKVSSKILGSQRGGDQMGALLGGAYILMSDLPATEVEAEIICKEFDFTNDKYDVTKTDHQQCYNYIVQQIVPVNGFSEKYTVGELIQIALTAEDYKPHIQGMINRPIAVAALRKYGLTVTKNTDEIAIATNYSQLLALLKNTIWQNGYKKVLERLPGARIGTAWFGDKQTHRAIIVPIKKEACEEVEGIEAF